MLSIGINLVTTDFNRKEVLVYHVCDDVTGKVLPVCGADIELSDDGDAASLIEEIRKGAVPLIPDPRFDDDIPHRMCGRCQKVLDCANQIRLRLNLVRQLAYRTERGSAGWESVLHC